MLFKNMVVFSCVRNNKLNSKKKEVRFLKVCSYFGVLKKAPARCARKFEHFKTKCTLKLEIGGRQAAPPKRKRERQHYQRGAVLHHLWAGAVEIARDRL